MSIYTPIKVTSKTLKKILKTLHKLGYTWSDGDSLIVNFPEANKLAIRLGALLVDSTTKSVCNANSSLSADSIYITLKDLTPLTNEEILTIFLKERKKYSAFKKYAYESKRKYLLGSINEYTVFTTTFNWSNTKEGYGYWQKCNDEWVNLVNKFNLTGGINFNNLK